MPNTPSIFAKLGVGTICLFPPLSSGDAFYLGSAGQFEAVHESDADLDFGGLAVWIS